MTKSTTTSKKLANILRKFSLNRKVKNDNSILLISTEEAAIDVVPLDSPVDTIDVAAESPAVVVFVPTKDRFKIMHTLWHSLRSIKTSKSIPGSTQEEEVVVKDITISHLDDVNGASPGLIATTTQLAFFKKMRSSLRKLSLKKKLVSNKEDVVEAKEPMVHVSEICLNVGEVVDPAPLMIPIQNFIHYSPQSIMSDGSDDDNTMTPEKRLDHRYSTALSEVFDDCDSESDFESESDGDSDYEMWW